jgi:hypothetical protein
MIIQKIMQNQFNGLCYVSVNLLHLSYFISLFTFQLSYKIGFALGCDIYLGKKASLFVLFVTFRFPKPWHFFSCS